MCFYDDTAAAEIYALSLHDALPISVVLVGVVDPATAPDLAVDRVDVHGEAPVRAHAVENLLDVGAVEDRKSTRLNSSHANISYAVFCLKNKISPARPRLSLFYSIAH